MKRAIAGVMTLLVAAVISALPSEAAVNYAKKLRGAKAIEVTYQSSYKDHVYPGETVVSICGDEVKIGSRMVVPKEKFIAWVEQHTTQPTSPAV